MNKLRRFAIAAAAAATVVAGSHVMAPAAYALPRTCAVINQQIKMYWSLGWANYNVGNYVLAYYYWGLAEGLSAGGPCIP